MCLGVNVGGALGRTPVLCAVEGGSLAMTHGGFEIENSGMGKDSGPLKFGKAPIPNRYRMEL